MAKIVIIGAGSHSFSKNLITDILFYPELRNSTISLMDIAQEPLELITAFAKNLVKQNGLQTKIESTTDRRVALNGANYVFVTIKVGGSQPSKLDKESLPDMVLTKLSAILPVPAASFRRPATFLPSWISAGIWKNFALTPGS